MLLRSTSVLHHSFEMEKEQRWHKHSPEESHKELHQVHNAVVLREGDLVGDKSKRDINDGVTGYQRTALCVKR